MDVILSSPFNALLAPYFTLLGGTSKEELDAVLKTMKEEARFYSLTVSSFPFNAMMHLFMLLKLAHEHCQVCSDVC